MRDVMAMSIGARMGSGRNGKTVRGTINLRLHLGQTTPRAINSIRIGAVEWKETAELVIRAPTIRAAALAATPEAIAAAVDSAVVDSEAAGSAAVVADDVSRKRTQ